MSDFEAMELYIYQPEPIYKKDGTLNDKIYGISGPGAEHLFDSRFTFEEAQEVLKKMRELSK